MQWTHQQQVEETVDWFCRKAVPDARDWHDATYIIQQVAKVDGQAWHVEVDIPTSADKVWFDFVIEAPTDADPSVTNAHAVRGGREDRTETYVWDDDASEWTTFKPKEEPTD